MWPPPSNSGKWRFCSGFPTENVIILVRIPRIHTHPAARELRIMLIEHNWRPVEVSRWCAVPCVSEGNWGTSPEKMGKPARARWIGQADRVAPRFGCYVSIGQAFLRTRLELQPDCTCEEPASVRCKKRTSQRDAANENRRRFGGCRQDLERRWTLLLGGGYIQNIPT